MPLPTSINTSNMALSIMVLSIMVLSIVQECHVSAGAGLHYIILDRAHRVNNGMAEIIPQGLVPARDEQVQFIVPFRNQPVDDL
jgi:hypothetical protein